MHLDRLRSFVAVAEELHFGRAAKTLHIAQPPLSRQIRALERELGVTLFDRNTRHVALAEAGRMIYPQARRLVVDADALARRVEEYRRGEGGLLRVGFVDSSSYEVMPALLRAYRQRQPAVEYELTSMSSDEQNAALLRGDIDLGLARTADMAGGLESTTVIDERLVIAVDDEHRFAAEARTSIADLSGEVFVGFDRRVSPSLHAELSRLLAKRNVHYDPIIEATEYTTILGLVAAGQGIAIVPAGVRTFRPDDLTYVELGDADATSSLLLLNRPGERSALVEQARMIASTLFPE